MVNLITEHMDIWTAAQTPKVNGGRGRGKTANVQSPHGIKKLRELILELAVRGKLVPQDPNDEPASVLIEKIAKKKARLIKEQKIKKQKPSSEITDDERPFELPEGWEWTRFGNISYQITDGAHHTPTYLSEGIPFLSVKDMSSGFLDFSQTRFISNEQHEELIKRCNPQRGDLLLTKVGTTGIPVLIETNKLFSIFVSVALIKFAQDQVSGKFLSLLVKSPLVKVQSKEGTEGIGNKNLVLRKITAFLITIPPLAEQHRIVAKVDELMALCDKLEQQQTDSNDTHQTLVETLLTTLTDTTDRDEFAEAWQRIANHFDTLFTTEQSVEQLKQTILQLAIMGKLVPQDPNDEPAESLLKKIVQERDRLIKEGKIKKQKQLPEITEDEKPFDLPQGWEWVRLQQIIRISSGDGLTAANMNNEGRIPVFGGNGITGYHDQANVTKPTLVIGRVGFYCGSIHITPTAAWITDNAFETTFSEENIYINFLNWLLKGTNLKENENATAQPVISGRKVYPIVVGLPPTAEQHRIAVKIDELMALCDTLKPRLNDVQTTQVKLADVIVEQAVV